MKKITYAPFTFDTPIVERLIQHMDMLKRQDVYEHTLYKKWYFLHHTYRKHLDLSQIVKAKIWTPENIDAAEQDITNLEPEIVHVTPNLHREWFTLKVFLSSFPPTSPPGRMLNFFVIDRKTDKYLGVATLASDMINMGARDKWIGWTNENKLEQGKLQCSPTAHLVIATQPFGYNFLGGKLVAGLLTTEKVRTLWKEVTGHPMVGVSTTSLYGASSQYNGIPQWKTLGESVGKITLIPDDSIYRELVLWFEREHPIEYKELLTNKGKKGPTTNLKQKILAASFRALEIDPTKYQHGHKRGIHYAALYENTREFLRNEITEEQLRLRPQFDIVEWWRPKALVRYEKLRSENRLKPEVMYYNDLVSMTWEEAKAKYIVEVGR